MWTNVFKIGGLHHISWFQFLPHESDLNSLPDKSVKIDQKDVATYMVLSSHLKLQKEGFLSTWTNSFVGPWDPSQGLHNPDEKIKLWLFLPGRHSSVLESAQASVSKLKVVASGVWLAPGDSEEVAAALSQALRNRIERELMGLSYVRFGDVFSKYQPFQSEEISRKGQSTAEFIFAATEEAIFVHVIISAKHVRTVSSSDVERISKRSTNFGCELPVIVYPHGMRGKLTGCSPSDLVKQVYFSSGKFKSTNGFIGLPHNVFQGSGCQLRGQNCFVEVTLGFPKSGNEKALYSSSHNVSNKPKHVDNEYSAIRRCNQMGQLANSSCCEKTFVYPAEAVLIPVLQTSFSRSSLKRFWLQNWTGPSLSGSSFAMHCAGSIEMMEGSWIESDRASTRDGYDSSSNSNSSSISSISSSSSDGDYKMPMEGGDLEADADSCRESGLTSNNQLQNNVPKMGSKRPRSGVMESFGQANTVTNASLDVSNSSITGIENIGSQWDWDDDDRGAAMDIQALLSEFGDFGDFFVDDALPFGEPPGTAESQALMFSASDCGDVGTSPMGVMDVPDQLLLPVSFPSFESFNPPPPPPPPSGTEESLSKGHDVVINDTTSALTTGTPVPSTGEFDHLVKAEALMTFAPEYGAVETPSTESLSVFTSPYLPKSRKPESPNSSPKSYVYGATPPSSPSFQKSDRKSSMSFSSNACTGRQDVNAGHHAKQYYTYVESRKEKHDKGSSVSGTGMTTCEGVAASPFSNTSSSNSVKPGQRKITDGSFSTENSPMFMKNSLATEVESIMFQVSMCRMRHTLLASSGHMPTGLNRLGGNTATAQLPGDSSTMTDDVSGNYEVKRRESIPIRIAGDNESTMLDGNLNAPVGVWRSVGVPKVSRPINSPSIEANASLTHNSFSEEGIISYNQRQSLQDFLDGMPLLVQQATCFVDVALDAECGDGPYGWLALQEQWRQGFSCGPSMIHAGCGGTLASCHSLDVAGVELVDPLSADVQAATVISLLQSDIKAALKSAFGVLDGPLSVADWCKGRNQSGDAGHVSDSFSAESTMTEGRDSSNVMSVGESMSPTMSSAGGPSCLKSDGMKMDDACQRKSNSDLRGLESDQLPYSRLRPTLSVLPSPSILVGYQDDWLKTSAGALQLWEKAPLEPYALQKPIIYNVICPDIDPLTSAAADFFQQLGTVYETCKLGAHSPQAIGNQMEIDSGKWSSSGFVLLDCPQSMKIESSNASLVGSISDYFLSLSNGWDLTSYLKSLSRTLKSLKLGPFFSTSQKEGSGSPCGVIYVVCPFPEPSAVLQTLIESSVAIGSVILQYDRDRRSILYNQVGKALMGSAAVDESSASNIPVIPGFNIPRLVLQIVTVDVIFRVTSPALSELVVLKETAFTVYNKARRISRGSSSDAIHSSLSGRSPLMLTQMASPLQGTWRDCVGSRMTGPSLSREGEIEASLRPATWDNTWQAARAGGLICDPNKMGECLLQDDTRYMFEPLFILAEPGSLEHGLSPTNFNSVTSEGYKPVSDDISGGFMHGTSSVGSVDTGSGSQLDGTGTDGFAASHQRTSSLHCCYGWTEDWRWLVCVWTDSRGELLDSNIFPFGGISSRQDTKGLQSIFVHVLQHGCQILQACSSSETCVTKPRDFVITRIGSFYELEYLEWQKALLSVGGSEMKWPLQLRRSMFNGLPASSNGTSLQQQEIGLMPERALPSSPSPLYSPHSKNSGFIKSALGQSAARKQLMGGHSSAESSKGMLQWVQSISFVTTSIDHSLQLVSQADSLISGGQSGGIGVHNYLEGFTPVKSLGSTSASYMLIPSPSTRFLPPTPLRLPTCLTAESPPLAHLLHSKGSAIPLSTGFVVSKAVPSMRKDRRNVKDEWPSVLSVSLVDYYGSNNASQEKSSRGIAKQGGRGLGSEARALETETHLVLEAVAAELHALSWMTVSPAYLDRRTALPFHCDMVLRLKRLLHFADKEIPRRPGK